MHCVSRILKNIMFCVQAKSLLKNHASFKRSLKLPQNKWFPTFSKIELNSLINSGNSKRCNKKLEQLLLYTIKGFSVLSTFAMKMVGKIAHNLVMSKIDNFFGSILERSFPRNS